MRAEHRGRVLIPAVALLVLALVLALAGPGVRSVAEAAPAAKASPSGMTVSTEDVVLKFGDPVNIGANETVEAVVSFGGDVTVAGTVRTTIVTFGGDVLLLPSASVGSGLRSSQDASVVAMGGAITVEQGAQVNGTLQRVGDDDWWRFVELDLPRPDLSRGGVSFFGWLVQTAVFLVLGLVAAALLPKQLLAVGRALAARPGGSLGWGVLVFFIIVPAAAIVLAISVIGILVLIPALVVVPLFYFFAGLSVAVFIAQRLLGRARQQGVMLATVVGVVGTTIISQIPVGGALAVLVMTLFGTGAAVVALLEWRKNRHSLPALATAGELDRGSDEQPPSETASGQQYGPNPPGPYDGAAPMPPAEDRPGTAPGGPGGDAPAAPPAAGPGAVAAEAVTAVSLPTEAEAPTVAAAPAEAETPTAVLSPPTPEAVTAVPAAPADSTYGEAAANRGAEAEAAPAADAGGAGSTGVSPRSEPGGPPRRRFGRGSR